MKTNFYIKGLDGLRAIASISVVIGHIELTKKNRGLENVYQYVEHWGHLGVVLFFVLSGFLITTLLVKEKTEKKKINIRNFYMRRILRVWPLYFLILVLSALIFQYSPSWFTLLLCSTIFPNIAHAFQLGWNVSPQIWSIGVEEQFYLFWPSLLKLNIKIILWFCILLILFLPIAPHGIQFILNRFGYPEETLKAVNDLFQVLSFNSMATGALASILYYSPKNTLKPLLAKSAFLAPIFVFGPFVIWILGVHFGMLNMPIYSVLFGITILYIAEGHGLKLFESNVFSFLGKISYGTYMYHWIIMLLMFELITPTNEIGNNIMLYLSILGLTLIVSYLSFRYVERFFLSLRSRFS